ncbi:MAG: acyl-CoA dehydrogenase [Pseudomonadales bacterium]|nr:MAG: acyl-CoA dehydrogenase [Pseudomonadales bacterium]
MPSYKAPLRDMHFLLNEVLDYPGHYQKLANGADATPDMVEAILEGAAQICEEVIAPLDQSGDEEGCHFEKGEVRTPKGFKEAYRQFVDGGWQGLSLPQEYGGQGLPMSVSLLKTEMVGTACWAFSMYPGLSLGCINTLLEYGSEQQKNHYLPHLVSGEWSGTMCLTEAQCGTDLSQVKTKAEPQSDGTYKITGTKIFISAGEHDLTDNIVHIVLARLPDAPKGTRGISLFLVPKVLLDDDGQLAERNSVNCGSIEHKMGIRASATAVLNFDEATGYLIAEPNQGLTAMFTFMNTARIGTAIQGVSHAERAYQGALPYAYERRSMRALSGTKEPEHDADAIIYHSNVRRMLLTQKAIAEGGRAMIYGASMLADFVFNATLTGDEEGAKKYDDKLGFYTPILKGFLTELGIEAASHGMQVFGGHGYIKEHGMEQIARDARIATMYEGTTGVQALDLLGRKVLMQTKGKAVRDYSKDLFAFTKRNFFADSTVGSIARTLGRRASQWNWLTTRIMLRAKDEPEAAGSASYDFLMYSGYLIMAYYWALQAETAAEKLKNGDGKESDEFYRGKLQTAEFYYERLLPRADAHKRCALAPTSSVQQMENETFALR